jgi:probable FeS assembly SUF system protein SufT
MISSKQITLRRDCDSVEIPSGARKTLSAGIPLRIMQARGGSYTVATDFGAMYRIDGKDADALGLSSSPATAAGPAGPLTEQMVLDRLKSIFDPEIPVNIVDLGLVYSCVIAPLEQGGNRIDVRMTMTAPGCGMGNVLKADVENKLAQLPEVSEVHVEIVFDPPWHAGLMSEAAKLQLGFDLDGDPAPSILPIFQEKKR